MDKINNYLFISYIMSYLNDNDIIKWADYKITKDIHSESITNISIANNRIIIILELKKLYNDKKEIVSEVGTDFLSLFRKINDFNLLHWKDIVKEICKLYKYGFIITANASEEVFFTRLNDYHDLIKDGLSGNMKMPEELNHFLSQYNNDIHQFKDLKINIRGFEVTNIINTLRLKKVLISPSTLELRFNEEFGDEIFQRILKFMGTTKYPNYYLFFDDYMGTYDISEYAKKYIELDRNRGYIKLNKEDIQRPKIIYDILNSSHEARLFIVDDIDFASPPYNIFYPVLHEGYSIYTSGYSITISKENVIEDWNLEDFQLDEPLRLKYPIFIFTNLDETTNNESVEIITDENKLFITSLKRFKTGYYNGSKVIDSNGVTYCIKKTDIIKFTGMSQILSFLKDKRKVVIDFEYKKETGGITLDDFKEKVSNIMGNHKKELIFKSNSITEIANLLI